MPSFIGLSVAAVTGFWWWRRVGRNSGPSTSLPGAPKRLPTWALENSAALLQAKAPIGAMNLYLDGFHVARGRPDRQIEAHHYCTQVNEEFMQCAIFDGNTADARLMGVEYIVSDRLYRGLPESERRLWHSHRHDVASGTLIAPGLPRVAELALMERLGSTWGKAWHTWDTERDALPMGEPELMVGVGADAGAREALVTDRDVRFGVCTELKRREREGLGRAG